MRLQQTLIPTHAKSYPMKDQNEKEMEEESDKNRFRPPMDTAEDPEHDQHIKKLKEQQKKHSTQRA
jgi:hypothetical protein